MLCAVRGSVCGVLPLCRCILSPRLRFARAFAVRLARSNSIGTILCLPVKYEHIIHTYSTATYPTRRSLSSIASHLLHFAFFLLFLQTMQRINTLHIQQPFLSSSQSIFACAIFFRIFFSDSILLLSSLSRAYLRTSSALRSRPDNYLMLLFFASSYFRFTS